jgi:glutaminyl-peptide cyclotransferase
MSPSIFPYFFVLAAVAFPAVFGRAEMPVLQGTATYYHDPNAFTQGLLFSNGFLYESTGEYGKSTLRKTEPTTGKVLAYVALPSRFFAEGLEQVGDQIFQLTWREGICFVYDKATLQKIGQFRYSGEGWGLTFDGESLIVSDGSSTLRFFDPSTFKQKQQIQVMDRNAKSKKPVPITNLNELEWIHGEIWANVWQTNNVVRIDPKTGNVLGWIDFSGFVPEEHKKDTQNCVLNGIAFDPATNKLYITGKKWKVMYEFSLK